MEPKIYAIKGEIHQYYKHWQSIGSKIHALYMLMGIK